MVNTKVALAILAYSICSGSMLLINKLVLTYIPLPSLVTCFQLVVCTIFIVFIRLLGIVKVDELQWDKVKPYLIYICAFALGIFSNMKALQTSNVDTVIMVRSCSPLVVSALDWQFLGRELPGARSTTALLGILMGATGYISVDSSLRLEGFQAYTWCVIYLLAICFEMCFGKYILSSVQLQTQSGPVYYTNVLGILPMLFFAFVINKEQYKFDSVKSDTAGHVLLTASCIVGIGISYSGWHCRNVVTATTYTVVGVSNKILTMIANVLIWDKHASPMGLTFLCLCLLSGAMYQQAPFRPESNPLDKELKQEPNEEKRKEDSEKKEEVEIRPVSSIPGNPHTKRTRNGLSVEP